jgi:hypothetical protein
MTKIYELPFDEETGRFEAETILADVIKSSGEGPLELESAEFAFPQDILELETDFAPGATEARAEAKVQDQVYDRTDFFDVIAQDYEVQLTVVPRVYQAPGAYKLGPSLTESCTVTCAEVPLAGDWIEPPKEERPLPAVPEMPVEIRLKVKLGEGGKPVDNLQVSWQRLDGCNQKGTIEPATETTESDGTVKFDYTPPELYYKPGDKFYEELLFSTEREGEQYDLVKIKIPLARYIKLKLRGEKQQELDDGLFGLKMEPELEVDLDAREKVKIVEAETYVSTTAEGETVKHAVAHAKVTVLVGDKNGVDESQAGIELETDELGKLRWELPELIEVFAGQGKTYTLDEERGELAEWQMHELTANTIKHYERKINQFCPLHLLTPELRSDLKKYRHIFCKQVADQPKEDFAKVISAVNLLGTSSGYSKSFNDIYGGVQGAAPTHFMNLAANAISIKLNLMSASDKLRQGIGWLGTKLDEGVELVLPASRRQWIWEYILEPMIDKSGSMMRGLIDRVSALLGSLARSAGGVLGTMLAEAQAGLAELGAELMEWMTARSSFAANAMSFTINALRTVLVGALSLLASLLKLLGKLIMVVLGFLIKAALTIMKGSLDKYQASGGMSLEKLEQHLRRIFADLDSETGDISGFGLNKYFDYLINELLGAWFHPSVKAGAGHASSIFNLMDPFADCALSEVYMDAELLRVPLDYRTKMNELKTNNTSVRTAVQQTEHTFASIDYVLDIVDTIVFCCEVAAILVALLLPAVAAALAAWGVSIGAGAIATSATKIENAVSFVKIFTSAAPQLLLSIGGAFAISLLYFYWTVDMTSQEA